MDPTQDDDSSGPSSLSSDQASLCVIPDPYDSFEEDGFIYLDRSSLPASLNTSEPGRTAIVFHSIDEEYAADECVLCQYIRPEGWQESVQDGISLFKVGWVTVAESTAYVAVPEPINATDPIGRVIFPADTLPKDTTNLYQFCYMRDTILLGASTPFQFKLSKVNSQDKAMEKDGDLEELHDVSFCNDEKLYEDGLNSMLNEQLCSVHQTLNSSSFILSDEKQLCLSEKDGKEIDMSHGKQEKLTSSCIDDTNQQKVLSTGLNHDTYSFNSSDMILSHGNLALHSDCVSSAVSDTNDQETVTHGLVEEKKKANQEEAFYCHPKSESVISGQGTEFPKQPLNEDLHCLKQRLMEVNEEKEWFQEQYNALLIAMKKYASDLSVERSEKESLNGHLAELMISHKMLCSENTRLNEELEKLKQKKQEISVEREPLLQKSVVLKSMINDTKDSFVCKCKSYKNQLDDLTARLSAYEVMRNCLEVELEEEIKLGQERDGYVAHLEKMKLHQLKISNNWLASTPSANPSMDGNTLLEMEENVNSTLEALECALKEMEVLRSRKAVITRANRVLREQIFQKREEWERQSIKQRDEFNSHLSDLQEQLQLERSIRFSLEKDVLTLNEKLQKQIESKSSDLEGVTKVDNEAFWPATKETYDQETNLDRDASCCYQQETKDTLMKNLEEARDEYKKLYSEKMKIQQKLERLQQKVRTKKNSRAQQEVRVPDISNTASSDFVENVTSTWRAIVDELM